MAGDAFNPRSGHIDAALTRLVRKFPTQTRLIADDICNVVPVSKETDKYHRIGDGALLDHRTLDPKAPGGESNSIDQYWDTDSYVCNPYALHTVLPDDTRNNADDQLGLEAEHAALPREAILRNRELRAASILFSTTYITQTAGAAATWDNATASNIKIWNDVLEAERVIEKTSGMEANGIAMGPKTWKAVATYVMSQAGTAAGVRWSGVAKMLNEAPGSIPRMFLGLNLSVGKMSYSTAKKPSSVTRSDSGLTDVWSDKALVFAKGRTGRKTVTLASFFLKEEKVRRGRLANTAEGDWFEYKRIETKEPKIIAAQCGYLITNTET